MNDETVEFVPFHAINEFMRDDYRLEVVRNTLAELPQLASEFQSPIEQLTRKHVTIPGFRNSIKAPAPLRTRLTAKAFEKSPELVAAILRAWAEIHNELREPVFNFLVEREWDILPAVADRSQLPGFLPYWPDEEDLGTLSEAFLQANPQIEASQDDVGLMIVWLGDCLPYPDDELEEEEEDDDGDDPETSYDTENGDDIEEA